MVLGCGTRSHQVGVGRRAHHEKAINKYVSWVPWRGWSGRYKPGPRQRSPEVAHDDHNVARSVPCNTTHTFLQWYMPQAYLFKALRSFPVHTGYESHLYWPAR
jgi:hypothetical protein